MKFIVKLHPEISIKSKPVRKRFTKLLESNIQIVLRLIDPDVKVVNQWDKLSVSSELIDEESRLAFIDSLKRVPGIVQFLEVQQRDFKDLHDIYQHVYDVYHEQLEGKTFAVRFKRSGKHDFTSNDAERYVGGGLNQNIASAKVQLTKPDITVMAEIKDDKIFVVKALHKAMGGFPIPTQEDVLSLMSGGFDSGVSTYLMIRKGARTHYCFFNLGGAAHEIGVKQVSYYLWNKYSRTHKVKFIAVDFEPVVAEILENVENGQMGVILKRMMMRAAAQVADKLGIQALVTGESLGQVSSQTLANLNVIDRVTEQLILRPLIHMDKQEIIDTAREIGTEDFAKTMPEYCGVISKKPTVKAVLSKIEKEEANFNFDILDNVVENARIMDIRKIEEEAQQEVKEVEMASALSSDSVVVDIRSPEEEDESPLELDPIKVVHIPFYKLATQFGDLPQDKEYFLYCDRGVMSKLQALLLHENGYANVKVYRP
ncbi:tRNA uracil 4-sulfurtransferase ThiI [Flocculibacter collagenilyticus]|uniref:tRNA uracil 4-sulfurtransferase ThiI n=1 Tax=Flocculibacter collagenilyticus TaxID=2744479 RepID=UPI0018F5109D|nr:tRNA uracil 4-sulfurtransferase ThiI [Flocculibacter collagenilyticus]